MVDHPTMLALNDISFRYRPRAADVIAQLSARAGAGSITGLLGPNAAGKSTLLRLILGLLQPQSGSISIAGRAWNSVPLHERSRKMAYVAQSVRITAPFTVREIVAMGRFTARSSSRAIDESLHACQLESLSNDLVSELSLGQQQRVALARSLAQLAGEQDTILLLDEPTSAMDLRNVQHTLALLRQQADTGTTIVIALHDLPQIAQIADHIWLMNNGKTIAAGPVESVLQPDILESAYGVPFGPPSPAFSQLCPRLTDD